MDKYGVVTETEVSKVASKEGRPCPQCGNGNVNYKGLVPHCSRCGVEPWEKKPDGDVKEEDPRR